MTSRSEAEEHLRVIRSLMEKATIYRAIAAPTALVGGLLAVAAAVTLHFRSEELARLFGASFSGLFISVWMLVLLITAAANVWFLREGARQRGEPFVSAGMRCALLALLPSYLAAAVCTAIFGSVGFVQGLPPLWMIAHGLGLLATAHFAPRSIALLGWAFVAAGLSLILVAVTWEKPVNPTLWMAPTFGLFHLLYAAGTWRRQASHGAAVTPK